MSDKFEKIIGVAGLGIIMVFFRVCARHADVFVKPVVKGISNVTERSITPASRLLAKQYITDANSKNDANIEKWNDKELVDYFLLDLAKSISKLSKLT